MTDARSLPSIDWTAEANLLRWEGETRWRTILAGELHMLVQAVNAAHDDPGEFHIVVAGGAVYAGNEIRLLGCDATRPPLDADYA